MSEEELESLRRQLKDAHKDFEDLTAQSNQIEKELTQELEGAEKAQQKLGKDLVEQKERAQEAQRKLQEQIIAYTDAQAQVERLGKELSEAKARIVGLETQNNGLEGEKRNAEATAERYKERYEKLLESNAVEKCELEELRQAAKERAAREKVEESEGKQGTATGEEVDKLRREAAFTKQLLREVVSALSKGQYNLPELSDLIPPKKTQ